jgi:hypothetical protein
MTTTAEAPASAAAQRTRRASDATRYLCAAAHLDSRFARMAVHAILQEEQRVIAPSFGVDVHTVLRHCVAARRRRGVRNALLALMVASPLYLSNELAGFYGIVLTFWAIVLAERCIATFGVMATYLRRDDPRPGDLTVRTPWPATHRQLQAVEQKAAGNVVVYSGYQPFVGCGKPIGGWSFVVDLGKGKAKPKRRDDDEDDQEPAVETPLPVDVAELHQHVGSVVEGLKLPGLTLQDRLFVNGLDIHHEPGMLRGWPPRPVPAVDDKQLHEVMRSPKHSVRHYKYIQVVDWDGDLILSIFLRFHKVGVDPSDSGHDPARPGGNLFVEANHALLLPIRPEYRTVDRLRYTPTVGTMLDVLREAAWTTFKLFVLWPFLVTRSAYWRVRWFSYRRRTRRELRSDPTFDYGALSSLREIGASSAYRRYFQRLDYQMHWKLVERRMLEAIVTFLDARLVATDELRDRQTSILNQEVTYSFAGANLRAESMAIGDRAKATVHRASGADGGPEASRSD